MGLQFVLGGSGTGKTEYLIDYTLEQSERRLQQNVILLVPEQFTLITEQAIINRHKNHGVFNINVLSFERLAHIVFEELSVKLKPVLDDCGKTLILRKVIQDNADRLTVYGKDTKKIGFVNEMKSLISELLQYSVSDDIIGSAVVSSKNRTLLNAKLEDISIIYKGFKQEIQDRFITNEEILSHLCKVLHRSSYIKNSEIILDGYTGFTPIQLQVLELLLIYARDVKISLTIPSFLDARKLLGKHELFYMSKETISLVSELADRNGIICKPDVVMEDVKRYNNNMLKLLEKNLSGGSSENCEECDGGVTIYEAFDVKSEIEYVIYMIKKLVESGNRFRDIAVVTGNSEEYGDVIAKLFEANGIKAFVDCKKSILNNPFVEFLRASISVMLENFSHNSVIRVLRTRFLDITVEECDIFDNYLLATGIKGVKAYKEVWFRNYKTLSAPQLEQVNEIRQKVIKQLLTLYDAVGKGVHKAKDIIMALYDYIESVQVYDKLAFISAGIEDDVLKHEFEVIYEEVMKLFERLYKLLGDDKIEIEEFLGILDTGLEQIKVGNIPSVLDNVIIGDIERTRLGKIKHLFVLGVNDGLIPGKKQNAGIFSDFDREKLKEFNIALSPTNRENSYIQQLYIYLNMTKPSDRLFLSYPRYDAAGSALKPSYLIRRVREIFNGLKVYKEQDFPDMNTYINTYSTKYDNKFSGIRNIDDIYIKNIYGETLLGSVSRIEKQIACSYAHFLRYGLRLKERRGFEVKSSDLGSLYHSVLKNVTMKIESSDYTFTDIPEEIRRSIIEKSVDEVSAGYNNTIMFATEKNKYMLEKLTNIVDRTIWAIGKQLSCGEFVPDASEMAFSPDNTSKEFLLNLSNGMDMHIDGRIDRIDSFEDDENVYVKVVDYKTYSESVDMTDIFYGLKLQLLVYLKAAMQIESKKHSGKKPVAAAMLYNTVKNPIVEEQENDAEIEAELLSKFTPDGYVNNDVNVLRLMENNLMEKSYAVPVSFSDGKVSSRSTKAIKHEDLEMLMNYAMNKVGESANDIVKGKISAEPFKKGERTACDYCEFRSACEFDITQEEYAYNKIKKKALEDINRIMTGGENNVSTD